MSQSIRVKGSQLRRLPVFDRAGRDARFPLADEPRAWQWVELALQTSEQRFQSLIENTSGIIAVLDWSGIIQYVNPPSHGILGYRPEELIGQCLAAYVHPQDLPLFTEFLAQVERQPGVLIPAEFRIEHGDGSCRLLGAMARNLLDDPGLQGIVLNAQDITDRRYLEEQLRQSQKMEAIGRLAGGVAHDFNNMLGAITGYADLLLDRAGYDAVTRSSLQEILKAADRAAALTRQLLTISRKGASTPRVIDLNEVTAGLHPMLRRLIGEDIELVTLPAPEVAPVKADPGQIEQVLLNLVINARDAMPRGGKLMIHVAEGSGASQGSGARGQGSAATQLLPPALSPEPWHLIPATLTPDASPLTPQVLLTVSDTGCGMDAETQSRIFEPFFTTKEEGKGTGLGLATVYGIVQQTGAQIEVESQVGAGTTFRIAFPRVEEAVPLKEAEPRLTPTATGSETILLVEDEELVRGLVGEVLRLHGYKVLEAIQGDDALRLYEEHRGEIDLLLTDVMMPGMSGRELAQRVVGLQPRTRVLFMSGYTDDAVLQDGIRDAEVSFIQKPFKPAALAQKVRETLAAR